MATHSSILSWKIAWTEEPGGLHSLWGRKELDPTERLHFHFHFFNAGDAGSIPGQETKIPHATG